MYLDRSTLRRMAGETIVCGFAGHGVDASLRAIAREVAPLGLIAFARNVDDAAQAAELCRELRAHQPRALLAIDHEGGPVTRLQRGVTQFPAMREVGALDRTEVAEQLGHGIGRELRAIGFDWNFAPVLDVDTNPHNPVIGRRAFDSAPERVARLGAAFVRGQQRAGVAACAKHFPGHGDTLVDSHVGLPEVHHERARLEAVEWHPYPAAIEQKVASIMTAHVRVHAIDPLRPATLSSAVLEDVLRRQLCFEGAIVADDIDMKGLSNTLAAKDVGAAALAAGCDILLACHEDDSTVALYEGIVRAAESGALPAAVLEARAARAVALRERWRLPLAAASDAARALERAREDNERLLAAHGLSEP